MIWTFSLLISCIKLLLLPAYRSTDFEVHRNWLAITHSLPLSQWYFEDTSEWTLDYPPLFAWFEYILSQIAQFFDHRMLNLDNFNHASFETILFQKLSVIVTDFIYIYGTYECSKALPKGKRSEIILPILLIGNVGLLMVDHIHFQYNGFLYGVFLISISHIIQGRILHGAFWFSILLNLKHIYLYVAPAFFIYLLRICFDTKSIRNFLRLAFIVITTFIVAYLPFIDHMDQILRRLFPFQRGLCHAYWAPNFWALYTGVDKFVIVIAARLGIRHISTAATMTGGLVQESAHVILPNITPKLTFALILITMIPALVKLWSSGAKPSQFLRCIVLCALTSFMFGWHVHEKAILMVIIPLSILAVMEPADANVFLILSTVGHYSLFPLLFPDNLMLVKLLFLLIYCCYAFYSLNSIYPFQFCKFSIPLLSNSESTYVLGLAPLFLYTEVLFRFTAVSTTLPFLPLMMTSIYCALGVSYCWFKYYTYFMRCKT